MKEYMRTGIVVSVFVLIACAGVFWSLSTPYIESTDELVYLTGVLQKNEGTLPDAYMLQGYAYGPYVYPHFLEWWYESLGYESFKSLALLFFIVATGLAGYTLARLLGLPWIPSLLFSILLLIPRNSAGTEFFGVLTFHEAIGRTLALPFFLLTSGILLKRVINKKPLWPVFAVSGLLLFLHPATVMVFVAVCLCGVLLLRIYQQRNIQTAIREVFLSGLMFILAGSYFFIEVFARLSRSVVSEGVSTVDYVQAVLFRNAWEFPEATLAWYTHMFLITAPFLLLLLASYLAPRLKTLHKKYVLPHASVLVVWGGSVALTSLFVALLLPGVNLYLMEHAGMSYVFQQWSRISKFYYLGLFVALIPTWYVLWGWYRESTHAIKHAVLAIVLLIGIASSTFVFELTQFAVGYPNYERAYVPQKWSHVTDGTRPAEYREVCNALIRQGATPTTVILSGEFALRYYCRADLYATGEEGAAYLQLKRRDLVGWYNAYHAQRKAFSSGNIDTMLAFAKETGASFIVVPRNEKFAAFESLAHTDGIVTSRHLVFMVEKP